MNITEQQQQALEVLAAKDAIRQCLATHARAIDRADAGLMKSIYHDDGAVDYGFFKGPIGEFADMLCEAQKAGAITLHRPSNVWIKVEGEKAVAESYVLAYFQSDTDSGPVQTLVGGRYLDRLEKRSGEWKLNHRHYVLDWNSNQASTANLAESSFAGGHFLPLGSHGPRDPGNVILAFHGAGATTHSNSEASMKSDEINNQTVDAMLARQRMQDLLAAYCRGVDRTDDKLVASIFHEDAEVVTGHFNGNGLDFAREITAWCRDNTVRTFHTISNQWFDVKGDSAVGETYVIALQTATVEGEDLDVLVGGRYLTRFERRNGEWKIAQHTFVMDWNMSQPSTAVFEGMFGQMTRGGRGADDPVHQFWAS